MQTERKCGAKNKSPARIGVAHRATLRIHYRSAFVCPWNYAFSGSNVSRRHAEGLTVAIAPVNEVRADETPLSPLPVRGESDEDLPVHVSCCESATKMYRD